MKVFVIVGTRPEAVKMAPVYKALSEAPGLVPLLISTGQHREMLSPVFDWFGLEADYDLDLMTPKQSLSGLMAKAIEGLERLIVELEPDAVLAQGDTATVCASAIAAFHNRIPFGHVEAGLRTRDLDHPFPEEGYRQMASRIARWHFCPTQKSLDALRAEKVAGDYHLVGNTVVDALLHTASLVNEPATPLSREKLVLITGHRRENHGARFKAAFEAIAVLAKTHPDTDFVYPVHLNPHVRDAAYVQLNEIDNITLIEPVAYPEMVALMKRAALIITDSGGVQEEAPSLKVPVLVMRETTERPEAIKAGVCELVGVDADLILKRAGAILSGEETRAFRDHQNPFGDGKAAQRIAAILSGGTPDPYFAEGKEVEFSQ